MSGPLKVSDPTRCLIPQGNISISQQVTRPATEGSWPWVVARVRTTAEGQNPRRLIPRWALQKQTHADGKGRPAHTSEEAESQLRADLGVCEGTGALCASVCVQGCVCV